MPVDLTFDTLGDLVGHEVTSGWTTVTQEMITGFGETTHDRQWIHLDVERARTESPYGTTIAHGFLTLSLISHLLRDAVAMRGGRLAVNYGLNKVRFTAAVPAGSRIRGRFTLQKLESVADAVHVTWRVIVERDGSDKPCLFAEWLVRYYP